MNPMLSKTPEERRAMRAKGAETRRRNKKLWEEIRQKGEIAVTQRESMLVAQIAELEARIEAVKVAIPIAEAAPMLTGSGLLTEGKIVEMSKPWADTCGIYFLIDAGRVIYVGQSVSVFARVPQHAGVKKFDSWAWLPCPKRGLDVLESLYIHALSPEQNGNCGDSKAAPIRFDDLMDRIAALPEPKPKVRILRGASAK